MLGLGEGKVRGQDMRVDHGRGGYRCFTSGSDGVLDLHGEDKPRKERVRTRQMTLTHRLSNVYSAVKE